MAHSTTNPKRPRKAHRALVPFASATVSDLQFPESSGFHAPLAMATAAPRALMGRSGSMRAEGALGARE